MNTFELKKKEKIVISVRMDIELVQYLQKLSYEKNISRNETIVQCILFALGNQIDYQTVKKADDTDN